LASGGNNQVVCENAGWSRSPQAQGSLLVLEVLLQIGQRGRRYGVDKRRNRERERERERERGSIRVAAW